MQPQFKKIIYDLGANNGDDIEYYLKKGEVVVAVEANAALCAVIIDRFKDEIRNGRLFVENCVLVADNCESEVFFYIHKHNHVLSQFPKPGDDDIKNFEKITLPSKSIKTLIATYGSPYYIKIDIEHYDEIILTELFNNNIYPPYISAESHNIGIFATLYALGKYRAFKLVDGESVSEKYLNHHIDGANMVEKYSFPKHSAGPFGNDIAGEWITADNFFKYLAIEGLGWKDIHATNVNLENPKFEQKIDAYKMIENINRYIVKPRINKKLWSAGSKIYRKFKNRI